MVMDGDWHEERPTLIDSSGWALNPECYYLNYLTLMKNIDPVSKNIDPAKQKKLFRWSRR
jgi:hypothetical protein